MKASFLGRVGAQPEKTRTTTGGQDVLDVSVAYKYGLKDKQTGEKPTQWVRLSLWGQSRCSMAMEAFSKGRLILFHVKDMHMEQYTNKDGQPVNTLVATIDDFEFVDSQKKSGDSSEQKIYDEAPF